MLLPFKARLARAQSTPTFDYYISTTGSDSNPGTMDSPWSITAINTKQSVYAGKRVGVLPGTYSMMTAAGGYTTGSNYVPQYCIAGGTSTSQTVIQSTVPLGAVLDGQATASNNPNGVPIIGCFGQEGKGAGQGYITLDGFEIINAYNAAVEMSWINGAGQPSQRIKGIVVQNCYIHAMTNQIQGENTAAITLYACDGAIVQNNYITNIEDSSNRGVGIEAWTSINCIIQYNTVISTTTGHTGGIFHKNVAQYNNTIRYNYIDMSFAGGTANGAEGCICMDSDGDGTTTSTVNNNIAIGQYGARWAAIDTGAYPASLDNQLWYNNTFITTTGDSTGIWTRYGAAQTITFYNNVIARTGNSGYEGDVSTLVSAPALFDYNLYPASPVFTLCANNSSGNPPDPQSTYNSLSAWAAALPAACVGKEAHSKNATAAFGGSGVLAQLYQLAAGSPGSKSGSNPGSTNGQTSGSATDMGAWGNGATQIGSNLMLSTPSAPQLSISGTSS